MSQQSIKRPRRFVGDLQGPTYQRNFTARVRIGMINSVDPNSGTCSISWNDKPGIKNDVLLLQANDSEFHIPSRGSAVVVFFDDKEQARILRYVNLGHQVKVDKVVLPKMREGEKMWVVGGTYVYLRANGSVQFFTATGMELLLDDPSGTLKSTSVNWKVSTAAGESYSGVVKRLTVNADGTSSVKVISNTLLQPYTEHSVAVREHPAQTPLDAAATPLLEITYGTIVDDNGFPVDRNNLPTTNPLQEIAAEIKFSSGVSITVNKNGGVQMWNAALNINEGSVDIDDPDIFPAGTSLNDPALGTKGQHVAREHDAIAVPFGMAYADPEHVGQVTNALANVTAVTAILSQYTCLTPGAPITPLVVPPIVNVELVGEIIEGARDVIIGDTVYAPI